MEFDYMLWNWTDRKSTEAHGQMKTLNSIADEVHVIQSKAPGQPLNGPCGYALSTATSNLKGLKVLPLKIKIQTHPLRVVSDSNHAPVYLRRRFIVLLKSTLATVVHCRQGTNILRNDEYITEVGDWQHWFWVIWSSAPFGFPQKGNFTKRARDKKVVVCWHQTHHIYIKSVV